MKRTLGWLAAAWLAACGGGDGGEETKPSLYKVTGTVQAADTKSALGGVLVYSESGASAKTGSDGAYALTLAKGAHTLSAQLDGYQTEQVKIDVQGDTQVPAIQLRPVGSGTNAELAITAVTPGSGTGGDVVTLQGVGFKSDGEATSVLLGAREITPDSVADGKITFTVPDDAASGELSLNVKVGAFKSNDRLFVVLPSLASVYESSAAPGDDEFTFTGTNLGFAQGAGTLKIGATALTVVSWGMSAVRFKLPAALAAGVHSVTANVGGVADLVFDVTLAPRLVSLGAGTAYAGDLLTLTGTHFGLAPTGNTVTLGGAAAAVASWSPGSVAVTVPAAAPPGAQEVRIRVGGVLSSAQSVTVKPSIAGLTPASGPVGGSVVVTGGNFGSTAGSVTFGGLAAAVSAWSGTSITVTVPAGLTIGATSVVVTAGGQASGVAVFGVSAAATGLDITTGSGGTPFALTGTSFGAAQGGNSVVVGGIPAVITSWSDTAITGTLPDAVTAGTRALGVVVGGQLSNTFNVLVVPQITARTPGIGQGGTTISFTGRNFGASQGASTLSFGAAATTAAFWSSTLIQAKIPLNATPGVQTVSLTVGGQTANSVTVAVAARIVSLAPLKGPAGSSITITGSNFGGTQGASTVTVGGAAALVTSWSSTQIVAVVPGTLGAVAHTVVVTVNGLAGSAGLFTVIPGISLVAPAVGSGGDAITLTGTNFGAAPFSNYVTLGTSAVAYTAWSNTAIQVSVPDTVTAGTHYFVVTVGGTPSSAAAFLVQPKIAALSAVSAPVGATLTITGTNFGAVKGTSTLTIGGVTPAIASWSQTQIVVTVPALGIGSQPVALSVGGQSAGKAFTIIPGINSLSPAGGIGITSVTLQGTNFGTSQGTSVVHFGAFLATVTTWSDTSIIVDVPGGLAGGAQNVYVVVGGLASNVKTFALTPGLSTRSPASGAAGTALTLTGTNFGTSQGTSTLVIGGAATTATSWSNASITVALPPTAEPGLQDVQVSVGGQTSNVLQVTVTPSIAGFAPVQAAAGQTITIQGANFGAVQGTGSVSFGGAAPTIVSWSARAIQVVVPNGAGGGSQTVTVTAGGQTSAGAAFVILPGITGLNRAFATGGDALTVTGTNFTASAAGNSLTVGGVAAAVNTWADASLSVAVPDTAEPGVQSVVATVGGRASNAVTLTVTPTINSIFAASGVAGDVIGISGSNFGAAAGTLKVGFLPVTPTSWSATSIVFAVPAAVTAGTHTVTVIAGGFVRTTSFTVKPNIDSVAPFTATGGDTLTIGGTNFGASQGASTLTFNGVATTATAWGMSQITVKVPTDVAAHTTVNVGVTVGGQASNAPGMTVKPTLLTRTPAVGVKGTVVTLTGTNLGTSQGASTLSFGGVATTATAWNMSSITARIPPGTGAGDKNVAVTVGFQASNTLSIGVKPVVTSVAPAAGPAGAAVTMSGNNFGGSQGASTVNVGSATAGITTWADSQIVWAVPSTVTAGVQSVSATVNGYTSAPVTFAVRPDIVSVSPATVTGGTLVTVIGTNFGAAPGASALALGPVAMTPLTWTNTSITFRTPTDLAGGLYGVAVTVGAQPSNTKPLHLQPSIYALSATTAASANNRYVTVYGANFGPAMGASTLTVAGASALIYDYSWTPNQFFFEMPLGLSIGGSQVVVTVGGEASAPVSLLVQPNLFVWSTYSYVGDTLHLGGNNFGATQGASVLTIGGVVTAATAWSDGDIYAVVPNGIAAGWQSVYVRVNGILSEQGSVYIEGHIDTVGPAQATVGDTVTLRGTNFGAPSAYTKVLLNGSLYLDAAGWADTAVSFVVPAAADPGVQSVTLYGNGSVNSRSLTLIPGVTSVAPSSARVGDTVIISGGAFGQWQAYNSYVTIGGVGAPIVAWSSTEIRARVPAGVAAGSQPVVVVGGGFSAAPRPLQVLPAITALTPDGGVAGSTLTISGSGFGAAQGASTVTFGTTDASVVAWSDTLLRVQVPPSLGFGGVLVTVTVNGATSNTSIFWVVLVAEPSGLTAYPASLTSVTLAWQDNSPDETAFEIWRREDAGPWHGLATVAANVTRYTDVNLTPGVQYTFKVAAVNAMGTGTFSDPATATIQAVTGVSRGSTAQSACAVTSAGALYCWGNGYYGAVGDGAYVDRYSPVPIMASGVSQAASSSWGTCAVKANGELWCWGYNMYGQLGDATYFGGMSNVPGRVTDFGAPVSSVSVGQYVSCGVSRAGAAKCWGYGTYLGDGVGSSRQSPGDVAGLTSGVKAVSVGAQHACALTTSGEVWCWGDNNVGQLGIGAYGGSAVAPIKTPGLSSIVKIAAGGSHTCAVDASGALYCWGANNMYQLGLSASVACASMNCVLSATLVASVTGLQDVTAGNSHTCVLTNAGAVKCFGYNGNGQLGQGYAAGPLSCGGSACTYNALTPVGLSSGVLGIAASADSTCAVTPQQGIRCWGAGDLAQIGDGIANGYRRVPAQVYGYATALTVSAGGSHTCGVDAGGVLKCWGFNGYNGNSILGNNATLYVQPTPDTVTTLATNVVAVSAGAYHSCALRKSGAAYCWGNNSFGALGINSAASAALPTQVDGLSSGVTKIAVSARYSGNFTCAIVSGAVKCWGYGGYGQRGDGTTGNYGYIPYQAVGLTSGATDVATGDQHACAVVSGTLYCWGDNAYGQLGTGDTARRSSPAPVTGLSSNITAVAAGENFTCALDATGAVRCWGDSTDYQLGGGVKSYFLTPQPVAGLSAGVAAITAGGRHACALLIGGGVKCWGKNDLHQIGNDSDAAAVETPADIVGLAAGVTSIDAGVSGTCAVLAGGTMRCWGTNNAKQIGDNYDTYSPRAVVGFVQ